MPKKLNAEQEARAWAIDIAMTALEGASHPEEQVSSAIALAPRIAAYILEQPENEADTEPEEDPYFEMHGDEGLAEWEKLLGISGPQIGDRVVIESPVWMNSYGELEEAHGHHPGAVGVVTDRHRHQGLRVRFDTGRSLNIHQDGLLRVEDLDRLAAERGVNPLAAALRKVGELEAQLREALVDRC